MVIVMESVRNADYCDETSRIQAALSYLSPDLPRDDWLQVLMAIRSSGLTDAEGIALTWSERGESFHPGSFRSTWRSLKPGKVTLGTLFYLAREQGYRHESSDIKPISVPPITKPSKQDLAEAEADKKKRRFERLAAEHDKLPRFTDWKGKNYLARKLAPVAHIVSTYPLDIRQSKGFIQYRLGNNVLQRIYDTPKEWLDGGNKQTFTRFQGAMSGAYFLSGVPCCDREIWIAEGLATALTVAATGRVVAVCLNAGNIPAAANALAEDYPGCPLRIAADNDKSFAGERAARSTDCSYAMPRVVGMDFNDLLTHCVLEPINHTLNNLRDTVTKDERYISHTIQPNCITVLKSSKGSGKTQVIRHYIESHPDQHTLIVTPSRVLGKFLSREFNAVFYGDFERQHDHILHASKHVLVSPESLDRIARCHFDTVIIDECEQTAMHWVNKETMAGKHQIHLDILIDKMKQAKTVIMADADADRATDILLSNLNKPVTRYINTHQEEDKELRVLPSKYESMVHIENALYDGKRLYIPCSQKATSQEVSILCQRLGKRCQVINSETSDQHREDIEHINDGRCHNLDVLVVTSAAASGLSIDNHSFNETVALFPYVHSLRASILTQMLCRVRNMKIFTAFIGGSSNKRLCTNPLTLEKRIRHCVNDTCAKAGFQNGEYQFHETLLALECHTRAQENLTNNNFRGRFLDEIQKEGYRLTLVKENPTDIVLGKALNKELKTLRTKDMAVELDNTPILSDEELAKASPTSAASIKTRCHQHLPDLPIQRDELVRAAIRSPTTLKRLEYNIELARLPINRAIARDREELHGSGKDHIDLKHHAREHRISQSILAFAGIPLQRKMLNERTWSKDDEDDIRVIMEAAFLHPKEIKQHPVAWLNSQLSSRFGIKIAHEKENEGRYYFVENADILHHWQTGKPAPFPPVNAPKSGTTGTPAPPETETALKRRKAINDGGCSDFRSVPTGTPP